MHAKVNKTFANAIKKRMGTRVGAAFSVHTLMARQRTLLRICRCGCSSSSRQYVGRSLQVTGQIISKEY